MREISQVQVFRPNLLFMFLLMAFLAAFGLILPASCQSEEGWGADANRKRASRSAHELEEILEPGPNNLPALKSELPNITSSLDRRAYVLKPFTAFLITVTNGSKRTIELDADNAVALSNGESRKCASMLEIENAIKLPDSPRHKYFKDVKASITAIATVGTAGAVTDQLNESGPVKDRYGFDEKRREDQLKLFSRRVLFPGESTSGLIYFKRKLPDRFKIEIQLRDFNNESESVTLSTEYLPEPADSKNNNNSAKPSGQSIN